MSFLRSPFTMLFANLSAIAGATYVLRSHHIYNLEEHEARMDELEGTLRGHIGLIGYPLLPSEVPESNAVKVSTESCMQINGDVMLTSNLALEEALDRLEGKASEADRGKKM